MKIVLITGVFDGLHAEHLNFLNKARQFVDKLNRSKPDYQLWVGIESDERVRQLKGPGRPIKTATQRKKDLEAAQVIDNVFLLPVNFSTDLEHEALIAKLQPKFLLVSSHTPFLAKKRELLEKYGGKLLVIHQQNPNISTTKLLAHNQSEERQKSL